MGLIKFTSQSVRWIFNILDKDQDLCDKLDMTALIQILIQKGKFIKAIPWNGPWCEVDSQKDLQVAQEITKIW